MADILSTAPLQKQIDIYAHKYKLYCFPLELVVKKNNSEKGYEKKVNAPAGWHNTKPGLTPTVCAHHNALGLVTGQYPSNIFVIDVDKGEDFDKLLDLNDEEEPLTWRQESGAGKFHLIFQYTEDLVDYKGRANAIQDHPTLQIDVRNKNNFIFLAPTSVGGKTYSWHPQRNPESMHTPLQLPLWLKNCLIKSAATKTKKPISRDGNAPQMVVSSSTHRARADAYAKSLLPRLTNTLYETLRIMSLGRKSNENENTYCDDDDDHDDDVDDMEDNSEFEA